MNDSELVNRDGEPIRKGRISPALRSAITLIVSEGLTVADAATRTGYKAHSLTQALKKPHVRAFRASVKRAWLDSRTEQSWVGLAKLADHACSEDVRYKSHRTFLEAAGELGGNAGQGEQLAKTLVQIIVNQGRDATQLPDGQMRGVIEAPAWRPFPLDASNSDPVGRVVSDDEEAP